MLPLLWEIREKVCLDSISGHQALVFLQMALPQYLFDETPWSQASGLLERSLVGHCAAAAPLSGCRAAVFCPGTACRMRPAVSLFYRGQGRNGEATR